METRTIALAGREYEVIELPAKANAAWRRKLDGALSPLLDTMQNAGRIKLDNRDDLSALIEQRRELLFRAPEVLTDLLFDYAPGLRQDREQIEAQAYESELLAALMQVLQLAYPFGGLFRMAERLNNGSVKQPAPPISMNSG